MNIHSACVIFFSPTGTTKKIVQAAVKGMEIPVSQTIDLSSPETRNNTAPPIDADIVFIGVPIYETEVPSILLSFLSDIRVYQKPAVLLAVYGNMSTGGALHQLYSIAAASGFEVIGAGSFIGEHSFSTKKTPIAAGRPDSEDLRQAQAFGKNILSKLQNVSAGDITIKIPPGKKPLMAKIMPRNSARLFTKTPIANTDLCNRCGICAMLCPMGAIDKNSLSVNEKLCLRCFACVKKCPKDVRKIVYRPYPLVSGVLKAKSRIAKAPEVYL